MATRTKRTTTANTAAAPNTGARPVVGIDRFRKKRNRNEPRYHRLTFTFPNEEQYVEYRHVELTDLILDGRISYEFTQEVVEGLRSIVDDPDAISDTSAAEDALGVMTSPAFQKMRPVMDALFAEAVVNPPMYLGEDEALANDGVWVGDIRLLDKVALFQAMNEEETAVSATFPADPQPQS